MTARTLPPKASSRPIPDPVLDGLVDALDELAGAACSQIYGELRSYASIPRHLLEAAVDRNLQVSLRVLHSGRIPAADQLDEPAQTARERFRAGVPVEDVIRGVRISLAGIHGRYVELCTRFGIQGTQIVVGSTLLWELSDVFTTRVASTYHHLNTEALRLDARQRMQAVQDLLRGRLPDGSALGLPFTPSAPYAAVRCQVPPEIDLEQVREALESTGSTPATRALVAAQGNECFGVVAKAPHAPERTTAAVGAFGGVTELAGSDLLAQRLLQVAYQLGLDGTIQLEDLGWRLAIPHAPEVTALYVRRYVTPLDSQGAFGQELLEVARAYLSEHRNVAATARRLHVHENTVRYRLQRYAALTGADLSDTEDSIGLTWALAATTRGHC